MPKLKQKLKCACKVCGKRHDYRVKHSPCPNCGEPLLATPGSNIKSDEKFAVGGLLHVPHFGGQCKKCGWIYGKKIKSSDMVKIPLHNLFEDTLGIGKINNREDFDKLIAELEAEDEAETKMEEAEKVEFPKRLKKCPKCGEYKGKVREKDLPPAPTFHNLPPRLVSAA